MKESEMQHIAQSIAIVIKNYKDEAKLSEIKSEIKELVSAYPIYPGLTVLE
jgi:glycine/serine hydroxymethyltransferase